MARGRVFLVFSILLTGMLPAAGAEITAHSKVDAVTVFPAGAEVTRSFEVSLKPGGHVIAVADLPAGLTEPSIRVEGGAANGLEISSVDVRQILAGKSAAGDGRGKSERKRLEKELQRLTDERKALDGAIAAAVAQRTLAENLSRLPASGPTGKDESKAATATGWNALFDLIGNRLVEASRAELAARIEQRTLDKRIKILKERLVLEPAEKRGRTAVRIYVEAREAARIPLRIRYQVERAGWTPVYDARLTTGGAGKEPHLTLARRASVAQKTGEDWVDAAITLSTVRPGAETSAPQLETQKVVFKPDTPPAPQPLASKSRGRSGAGGLMGMLETAPTQERPATVETAPYQAAFAIPQRVTVRSGVGRKKVFIAAENLKPALAVRTTPKKDATAFLHARFTYEGLAPVLPGKVSLYRDGVFAGRAELPLIVSGEEQELGFGRDDAVKVTRVELQRAKGETGIIRTSSTDEQHLKITVRNLHDWTVPVTVIDQVPVSEHEKIEIEILPMTTEPSESNYEEKQGVLAWTFDLKPQEQNEIALSYEIRWPAKREIIVGE